jgi:hypothetical protein
MGFLASPSIPSLGNFNVGFNFTDTRTPQAQEGGVDFTDVWGKANETLQSVFGYKLQSQQIKSNQRPSITYDKNGRPIGDTELTKAGNIFGGYGGVSSSFLLIAGGFILIVLLVGKR